MRNSTLPGVRQASRIVDRRRNGDKLQVAIYLRVSTKAQVDGSGLKEQQARARAWIDCHLRDTPYEIVGVFADDGISGKVKDRRDQKRLKKLIDDGSVDVVIADKLDRLGRTMRDIQEWVWEMTDQGLWVVSADGMIDSTSQIFSMVLALLAYLAELEHEMIFSRTFSGRENKLDRGGWIGGPPPYGFELEGIGSKEGSKVVLREDECRILVIACDQLVDEGMNYSETVEYLNINGWRTRSGRLWTVGNLAKRIANEAILEGFVTYRKNNGWKGSAKVDEDGILKYGESKRIPMPDVFDEKRRKQLKERIAELSLESRRENSLYPLTGRIVGNCGEVYIGGGVRGDETRVYRCKGNYEGCDDVYLDAADVEILVWSELAELLGDPERVQPLVKEWVDSPPGTKQNHENRVVELRKLVEEKEDEVSRLMLNAVRLKIDEKATHRALEAPNRELLALRTSLVNAVALLEEHEASQQEARAMEEFVAGVRLQQGTLELPQMAELFAICDVRVMAENHRFKKKPGTRCPVVEWHKAERVAVPADVSEDEWVAVQQQVLEGYFSKLSFSKSKVDLRLALNGMLHRLRTGITWAELPSEFGPAQRVRERQLSWWKKGAWTALVSWLNGQRPGTATPVHVHPTIPPLRITGRVARS